MTRPADRAPRAADHEISVEHHYDGRGRRGRCRCGWTGAWRTAGAAIVTAAADGDDHLGGIDFDQFDLFDHPDHP